MTAARLNSNLFQAKRRRASPPEIKRLAHVGASRVARAQRREAEAGFDQLVDGGRVHHRVIDEPTPREWRNQQRRDARARPPSHISWIATLRSR